MLALATYQQNFAPHAIPPMLAALLELQNAKASFFSAGFELAADADKSAFTSWSDDAAFLDGLLPIGQANGSGSIYALWIGSGGTPTTAPVVVFGDEGGVHVVAADLVTLLRILTLDAEPMIDHDSVDYYKDEDGDDASARAADYVAWLATHARQKPVTGSDEVEQLVAAAQAKHGKALAAWMKPFHAG